jgi:trans-aconitate methyltransferase
LTATSWDAEQYQNSYSFVWELGSDLLALLAPQVGECVLDLGCGTGQLTAKIADSGATARGVDSAASMIEKARANFPQVQFQVLDATRLNFDNEFDAVFSNAVLHWIKDPRAVVRGVCRALKPGGRFVAEFGGKGNVKAIITAVSQALEAHGSNVEDACPWYFPSIGEYASLVEDQGMAVNFALLFDRPTPLEGGDDGLRNWVRMFLPNVVPAAQPEQFLRQVEHNAHRTFYRDGTWFADYRRLRLVAVKSRQQ